MSIHEVHALIRLLDDNDSEVFQQIETRLVTLGKDVIPHLETAWSSSLDALMQMRIENIIHKIQFEDLLQQIRVWASTGCIDLFKGALLIARHQYPDLNEQDITRHLDKIKKDAWLEMNPKLTALEQVRVLNRVFYDIHGFNGNTTNYHAPQNSYVNICLESKKGNPLMLAILYIEVARSAELPVYGVNLPEHFVLCYKDDDMLVPLYAGDDIAKILFYINPFSKGDIFSRKELDSFLKQLKLEPQKSFFEPCTNREMIQRLIRNLSNSYQKLGHMDKVEELEQMMRATE
jgi:regulator of sirC expression with transglutaminase-like and TPR domain